MEKSKKKYQDFKVDIFGEEWSVKFSPIVLCNNAIPSAGLCDYPSLTISIDDTQDHKMVIITLFHELFHAYVRRSGIYNASLSMDMEEIIADQFGTVIGENFDFNI